MLIRKGIALGIGATVAIVLLYFNSNSFKTEEKFTAGFFVIAGGVLIGGMVSGFIIDKLLINSSGEAGRTVGTILGGLIVSPLSFYCSIILGTLGGGIGSSIGRIVRFEQLGINIGILVSIVIVFALCETIAAKVGGALGGTGHALFLRLTS